MQLLGAVEVNGSQHDIWYIMISVVSGYSGGLRHYIKPGINAYITFILLKHFYWKYCIIKNTIQALLFD